MSLSAKKYNKTTAQLTFGPTNLLGLDDEFFLDRLHSEDFICFDVIDHVDLAI
jgi:hypothetical protein